MTPQELTRTFGKSYSVMIVVTSYWMTLSLSRVNCQQRNSAALLPDVEHIDFRKAITCYERPSVTLACPPDHLLRIERVVFGVFVQVCHAECCSSPDDCNAEITRIDGLLNVSKAGVSPEEGRVLMEADKRIVRECAGKGSCVVNYSEEVRVRRCEGDGNYVSVVYGCVTLNPPTTTATTTTTTIAATKKRITKATTINIPGLPNRLQSSSIYREMHSTTVDNSIRYLKNTSTTTRAAAPSQQTTESDAINLADAADATDAADSAAADAADFQLADDPVGYPATITADEKREEFKKDEEKDRSDSILILESTAAVAALTKQAVQTDDDQITSAVTRDHGQASLAGGHLPFIVLLVLVALLVSAGAAGCVGVCVAVKSSKRKRHQEATQPETATLRSPIKRTENYYI